MPGKPANMRRYERADASVCTWLQYVNSLAIHGTTTLDIGEAGARFEVTHPMRVGDQVRVNMQFEDNPYTLECQGKVCWAAPTADGAYNIGVAFHGMLQEDRLRLSQEVRQSRRLVAPM